MRSSRWAARTISCGCWRGSRRCSPSSARDAGKNLLTAYGRAANIVRAEEKKDKALAAKIAGAPDAALLEQAEEKAVAIALWRRSNAR